MSRFKDFKLFFVSSIANIFEWYDYALFAHFAVLLGNKFFPESTSSKQVLYAFSAFAAGYIMRPIGGIFFGSLGDRKGRKVALSLSVIFMALPTAIIAILPTYEHIGILATIIIVISRLIQGFSMGGALTGSISFIIEHSKKHNMGVLGAVPMSGICIGILLGSLIISFTRSLLSTDDFQQWGWRVPFIIGSVIFFIGIYIRRHARETPVFEDLKTQNITNKSPIRKIIVHRYKDIISSVGLNSAGSVIFYLQAIFVSSYLSSARGFSDTYVSNLLNFSFILMSVVTLISGYISDVIGRRKIFIILFILIAGVALPALLAFSTSGRFAISAAYIILSILAAAFIGAEPALQAEFYDARIRSTALAISYNLGVAIFGGLTPYIAQFIINKGGTIVQIYYYILLCVIFGLFSLRRFKKQV